MQPETPTPADVTEPDAAGDAAHATDAAPTDATSEFSPATDAERTADSPAGDESGKGNDDGGAVHAVAVLGAVAASPDAFIDATPEIARAAKDIFLRQVSTRGLTLDGLRRLHDAVGGPAFASFVPGMKPGDLSRLVVGIDPNKPGVSSLATDLALARVVEIAGGSAPTAAADLESMDLAALRALRETLGSDFPAWVAALKGGEARKAAVRLDPDRPGVSALEPNAARSHLDALAGDLEPTLPVRIEEIDLAGLRTAREYLGDGFPTWISELKQGDAKKALLRFDPNLPGLSGMDGTVIKARLSALAGGAEPTVAIPLDDLDIAGLGAARESVGREAFDAWLADLKPAEAKKAVIRLDPDRPGVRKLRPEEYREALASLAERMAPHGAGRRVPGVGEITFGQARHDEARFPDGTDEGEA